MPARFEDCALMKFLAEDEEYRARVLLLGKELEKWLQYSIATFPHYTDHTRGHSEQIVQQLSKLLFRGGAPTLELSRAEAYVLVCAAWLHDAGMVASPGELESLLDSERWRDFVAGKGAGGYPRVQALRARAREQETDLAHFQAALELRLLIADYLRREHHLRARLVLELHPEVRRLVDLGDRRYFEAIAAVAVGHGLDRAELNDSSRYKEVADLGGEPVNVRLMARLLRIGDLLDMRAWRAAPCVLAAAGPLPADSQPHWQQYSTITHERVDADRIEYTCECQDQDTHAVLRDWFGWLVDEVRETGLAMIHAERHTGWRPPRCTLDEEDRDGHGEAPTILIKPAPQATYTFHRWRLELDQGQILDRLIYDVYDSPETFIRELLQNALDATRCQMYEALPLRYPDAAPPEYPDHLPEPLRRDYPVSLRLAEEDVTFPGTDQPKRAQVFTIEDFGTGMDSHVIRRYLLQVGRSFYQSEEFRRRYRFVPTSRFGVGFLSVFAVSSFITVETARLPLPAGEPYGIRLTLQGPRSYLLTDRWKPFEERAAHRRHGTRIRVALDRPMKPGELTRLARDWCRRVEVPIDVTDLDGQRVTLSAQRMKDHSQVAESLRNPGTRYELRAFEVRAPGLEGEVYRVVKVDEHGEDWSVLDRRSLGIAEHLLDLEEHLPNGYVALHGIKQGQLINEDDTSWRVSVDDRRPGARYTLARAFQMTARGPSYFLHLSPDVAPIVQERIHAAVAEHLRDSPRARGPDGWRYIGGVLSDPVIAFEFACSWPGLVPIHEHGMERLASGREALGPEGRPLILLKRRTGRELHGEWGPTEGLGSVPATAMWYGGVPLFMKRWIDGRLLEGEIDSVHVMGGGAWMAVRLGAEPGTREIRFHGVIAPIDDPRIRAMSFGSSHYSLINATHPLVRWWLSLRNAVREGRTGDSHVAPEIVERLLQDLDGPGGAHLEQVLEEWRRLPGLPADLRPPPSGGAQDGGLEGGGYLVME